MKYIFVLILVLNTGFTLNAEVSIFNNFSDSIPCPDSLVCDITVDGVTIDGFHPDTLHYTLVLPDSITSLPIVSFIPCDSLSNPIITYTQGTLPLPDIVYFEIQEDTCFTQYSVLLTTELMNIVEGEMPVFSLYPNPAYESVNIQLNSELITHCEVLDLSGRLVESIPLLEGQKKYVLDVQDYGSGIHFIEVFQGKERIQTEQLIIK